MIKLAFYSLFRRPLRQFLLFLLIALSAAEPVFLLQVTDGLYEGINHSVRPFPILVGAKGSSYQLVLNTVFLRDRPIGNIPYTEMDKLEDSGKVQAVYPLAFGDNYRGFRIVGTDEAIFSYKPDKTSAPWLSIAGGKGFGEEGAAVIGSETVRLAGLKIGDTFHSIHGLADKGKEHNHAFKVVGILAPCGGPYDTAIFVDIHEVWEEHGITTADKQEVTAILTVPKGYREAMQLLSAYQKNHDVQMVFPSQNVIQLYSMIGQTRHFWTGLVVSLIGISLMITLLVMYWSGLGRMPELALLQALGAGKHQIITMLLAEEGMLLLFGTVCGWLLAYGAFLLTASAIQGNAAIVLETAPDWRGLLTIPVMTILGTLAGLIPAGMIGRKDVSEYL